MRFFNTAGPVRYKDHYCLPPLERFDLNEVLRLIEQKKYFVLHAPRQTGKTTCLLALMDFLNGEGKYSCLYVNVELAQAARENVGQGMKAILNEMASWAKHSLHDPYLESIWLEVLKKSGEFGALVEVLTRWAEINPKPLVLLIDEIDALIGDTLISVLRQLRAGYTKRPALFPQSIVLCGVRDVRDYRIQSSRDKAIITGGSAFNIKAESLRLGDFVRSEVERLYTQHTEETGQLFENDALDLVWELTHGQPWLVNSLGYKVCFELEKGRDRSNPITLDMAEQAKENLILRHETHLDQLVDKLAEERIRSVIEPILAGADNPDLIPTDDVWYARDLGLIRTDGGQLQLANRIYQEVIPRALTYTTQLTISHQLAWYVATNGSLNMDGLLAAFQQFFREHSESWLEKFDYKEAGPQLLMQAFLQRIINSDGRVEREYGLGRMRTDLLIIWKFDDQVQRVVIELKIVHGSMKTTIEKGIKQTWQYMDRSNAKEGHLLIFDRKESKPWQEKIFKIEKDYQGQKITVWGM